MKPLCRFATVLVRLFAIAFVATLGFGQQGFAQSDEDATFDIKMMTPETAMRAAQAALASCREAGYQVTVAVVDRTGQLQVLLRDRFAGAHTLGFATDKAWTAASFKVSTAQLRDATAAGRPENSLRHVPRVATVGGGLPIQAAGSLVGAIGISGAPGGEADEQCAQAGIAAVEDDLAF